MNVAPPSDPDLLWMAVHYDDRGTGGIIRDGLPRQEAEELCEAYHRKGHHQTYVALPYTRETKAEVMRRERILP